MGKASRSKWEKRLERAQKKSSARVAEGSNFGLFIGFIAVALAIILYVLQSNGVEVSWGLSALLYVASISVATWSTVVHAMPTKPRLKYAAASLVIVILGVPSSIGVANQYKREHPAPVPAVVQLPPPDAQYMSSWGSIPGGSSIKLNPNNGTVISGDAAGRVEAAGNLLLPYADKYDLMAACFHWDGSLDYKDVRNISKSAVIGITKGEISLRIPWNTQFIMETPRVRPQQAEYALLLIPKGTDPSQITTLRDATHLGGFVLHVTGGPQ